jgi:hypothetical protein
MVDLQRHKLHTVLSCRPRRPRRLPHRRYCRSPPPDRHCLHSRRFQRLRTSCTFARRPRRDWHSQGPLHKCCPHSISGRWLHKARKFRQLRLPAPGTGDLLHTRVDPLSPGNTAAPTHRTHCTSCRRKGHRADKYFQDSTPPQAHRSSYTCLVPRRADSRNRGRCCKHFPRSRPGHQPHKEHRQHRRPHFLRALLYRPRQHHPRPRVLR